MSSSVTSGIVAGLQALATLNPIANHLGNSSKVTTTVSNLLTDIQIKPANAEQIAIQIAAIQGVPATVLPYVTQLETADPAAVPGLVAQAQSALAQWMASHANLASEIMTGLAGG